MKTYFDCIPCLVRQALDSARLVTDDEALHERLLREVLQTASKMDLRQSPPAMSQRFHRLIRDLTGESDPYRQIKDWFNGFALGIYPRLKVRVRCSVQPMETAVRLAIAGNVIDMGVHSYLNVSDVHDALEHALTSPLDGDVEGFSEVVSDAEHILYLADNAGEIVFDRLLIEQMQMKKVTVAVRGSPVVNDATIVDAQAAGLAERVEVINNGSDAPGTLLHECSEAFLRRFNNADLIIAKGQGNYETLSESEKDIFFALKAKCPLIARDLGCQVNSLVLRRSTHGMTVVKRVECFASK